MLFTSVEFHERDEKLEVKVTPGNYVSNMAGLIFYFILVLLIDGGALWFYLDQNADAFPCFMVIGIFTLAIVPIFRVLTRELFRELIIIDKDEIIITTKKLLGIKKTERYSRGGIFKFWYGDQHVEGNLFFIYENNVVRFCRMLHPEDTVETYEKILKYFNTIGHFIKPGDPDVIEVEPEEIPGEGNNFPIKRNG